MHPNFETHFKQLFGSSYPAFLKAIEEHTEVSMRLNPLKMQSVDFEDAEKIPWSLNGYFLKERPKFYADPLHHAGGYYVQESSSMFFGQVIPVEKNIVALDLCASPGGKSTLIQSRISENSVLISNELDLKRNKVLAQNLNRWGADNVIVTNASSKALVSTGVLYDFILVDAPCSGEGMFRKDKVSLEQWSPNFVSSCAAIQEEILDDALKMLKPGGVLVYSTCTFEPIENERQIARVLQSDDFEPISIPNDGWAEKGALIQDGLTEFPYYYFYLEHSRGEGQFVMAIRKKGDSGEQSFRKSKKELVKTLQKKEVQRINEFMDLPTHLSLLEVNGNVHTFPKNKEHLIHKLMEKIPLWKLGTRVGELSRNHFKPHHDWAMTPWMKNFPTKFELDYALAIRYLKKEEVKVDPQWSRGIGIATYKGIPLGWAKNLGTRLNNSFPKELVIKKTI